MAESDDDSLAKEFKQAIEASDYSKSELGRLVGVSPQSVYHWERRGVPPRYAFQVAALLSVAPSAISHVVSAPESPVGESNVLTVPVFDESGAARYDYMLDVSRLAVADQDVRALEIGSAAMAPRLNAGDLVFFLYGRSPHPGELCVAKTGQGELIVRRYRLTDTEGAVQLLAESPDWPTLISEKNDGKIENFCSILFSICLSQAPPEVSRR